MGSSGPPRCARRWHRRVSRSRADVPVGRDRRRPGPPAARVRSPPLCIPRLWPPLPPIARPSLEYGDLGSWIDLADQAIRRAGCARAQGMDTGKSGAEESG
jgi:hypothetical protein